MLAIIVETQGSDIGSLRAVVIRSFISPNSGSVV
jgi:hypothetical protein